jgi:diguanylate cyclase (GGDEF)-like protein
MRLPAASTAAVLAVTAGCLGLVVMVGWLAHIPVLVDFGVGRRAMPFDAELGLALAGFTWACVAGGDRGAARAAPIVGGGLVALGLLILAEIAFGLELSVDLPGRHAGMALNPRHPGRLSAPTCSWFVLFGAFLLLFQARGRRWAALCLEPLAFILLLISMIGLISNWLSIEDLYRWRDSPRMALPTAVGLTLMSASAWVGLRHDSRIQQLYATREEWILTILAGEILILMAFIGGLAGFAALQHSLEAQLSESLRLNLANRAQTFDTLLTGSVQTAAVLASRAALVRSVQRAADDGDPEATAELESSARGFLLLGFKHIAYRDRTGRVLAQAGDDARDPGVALLLPNDARLAWDERGFVLHHRLAMRAGQDAVGWLETTQYLPQLTDGYRDMGTLGQTADSLLCARTGGTGGDGLMCFPGRNAAEVALHAGPVDADDPLVLALAGGHGMARFIDARREQVIAAYSPVGALGLGLMLKVDLRELYAPVRRELEHVLPLLLGLVLLGTLVLSSQVTPLASRLRRLATLDGLTGVLNRATYLRLSEHELDVAKRRHQPVAIVMLDADHFKKVNDTYGHDVGDEVLKLLSATCRSALRAVDVIGRLGGEEFALTLPDTSLEGARLVADRLRQRIAELEVKTKKGRLSFTVSIGIAGYPGHLAPGGTSSGAASGGAASGAPGASDTADDVASLLKTADEALYVAKGSGRNRVVIAAPRVAEAAE